MGARSVNAVLGLWLFFSAFLWEHTSRQFHNAWVVGVVVVTAALAGLGGARWGRVVNGVLGGWLIVTALMWNPGADPTFWNHAIVGAALALFASAPSLRAVRDRSLPTST
jgi:hypothetical protein